MAIIPSALYPMQVDTDAAYPHGKARNAGSFQDGTGTPLEQKWLNDDWGFKQALLAAAAITPSGNPDKVGASQYLNAILDIALPKMALYKVASSGVAGVTTLTLLELFKRGGFTIAGAFVMVPPGKYLTLLAGTFRSASVANPIDIRVSASTVDGLGGGFGTRSSQATRRSAVATDAVALSFMGMWTATADEAQGVCIEAETVGGGGLITAVGALLIVTL